MGCQYSSTERVEKKKVNTIRNKGRQEEYIDDADILRIKSFIFEKVLKSCNTISTPPNLMPTVCLGKNSFPILIYDLQTEKEKSSDNFIGFSIIKISAMFIS